MACDKAPLTFLCMPNPPMAEDNREAIVRDGMLSLIIQAGGKFASSGRVHRAIAGGYCPRVSTLYSPYQRGARDLPPSMLSYFHAYGVPASLPGILRCSICVPSSACPLTPPPTPVSSGLLRNLSVTCTLAPFTLEEYGTHKRRLHWIMPPRFSLQLA